MTNVRGVPCWYGEKERERVNVLIRKVRKEGQMVVGEENRLAASREISDKTRERETRSKHSSSVCHSELEGNRR